MLSDNPIGIFYRRTEEPCNSRLDLCTSRFYWYIDKSEPLKSRCYWYIDKSEPLKSRCYQYIDKSEPLKSRFYHYTVKWHNWMRVHYQCTSRFYTCIVIFMGYNNKNYGHASNTYTLYINTIQYNNLYIYTNPVLFVYTLQAQDSLCNWIFEIVMVSRCCHLLVKLTAY